VINQVCLNKRFGHAKRHLKTTESKLGGRKVVVPAKRLRRPPRVRPNIENMSNQRLHGARCTVDSASHYARGNPLRDKSVAHEADAQQWLWRRVKICTVSR